MQRAALLFFFLLLLTTHRTNAQPFFESASYAMTSYVANVDEGFSTASFTAVPEYKAVTIPQLAMLLTAKQRTNQIIGITKEQRPVTVHYFPGKSDKWALVIGGVHGTELSSIEVANRLVQHLAEGDTLFYNVLVIPSLFPDNAARAIRQPATIGSDANIGRYTHAEAPDPNRQMPALGKAYNPQSNTDALGRHIEYENALLLQLIQMCKPDRILNIHAIRDTAHGGIYADPRTDAAGYAFPFASDSSLAVCMAQYVEVNGGAAPGNHLDAMPTALYYKDPPVAAPGQWQKRNCQGSSLSGNRGQGVSLGSWASTAVSDSANAANNRPAIRLFTMEFPGCKRPQDYGMAQQPYYDKQVVLYAAAIRNVFLAALYVEE